MTRFQLIVRPDGRAVLATPQRLTEAEQLVLREAVKGWESGHLLVLTETDVVRVVDVDIELHAPVAASPAGVA